jgi:hypothetical protein
VKAGVEVDPLISSHFILWQLDSPLISDGEASYKIYLDIRVL